MKISIITVTLNSERTKRDTLNRWNGEGWGIAEQKWSKKSVEDINALDLDSYFKLLDKRGNGKKGSMAKVKEAQKSLLKHLIKKQEQIYRNYKISFTQLSPNKLKR